MLDTEIRTNPFPGLRSFEQDEEYLFFGREKQIDELLKKLRTTRFLSVIGSSGSGKSSLVKSGLLPSLHSGYMTTAGSSWRVALFRPGNDPIGNLAQVLSESGTLYDHDGEDTMYTSIIEATLRRSRLGLFEAVRQSNLTKGENLLVIVDQFEELFRYSKYEEREHGEKVTSQAFINLLLNAINHEEANIYIGLTMRSDFLGDCTQFRNLPEAINEGQYLIPRMTRDDIKQAISGPVAVGGGEITPRLLTQLLNDVGDSPDQLPILQHALMRTWDYWEQNHKAEEPLDLIHYEAIGTMSKALSMHAEEALSDLPSDKHKNLAEVLFKSLTDHGGKGQGIRRPTQMDEICELANASFDEISTVIESFRKRGRSLLMPPVGVPLEDSTIVDISHESLMRVWTRLKKWDEEESGAAETYMRLANDAAMYQEGKMGLLRGPELELALIWKEENQPNQKWAQRYNPSFERAVIYLDHSKEQNDFEIEQKEIEQKKRLTRARRTILLIAGLAIVFLILMIQAFLLRSEAEAARLEAKKNETMAVEATKKAKKNETLAIEATKKAEKNETLAIEATKKAQEEKKRAERAAIRADSAKVAALESKRYAEIQKDLAEASKKTAQDERDIANTLRIEAEEAKDKEIKAKEKETFAKNEAIREKNRAERLHNLEKSRDLSFIAIQEINDGKYLIGADRAIKAHKLNIENDGPRQNRDNYNALSAALQGLQPNKQTMKSHNQSVRAIALSSVNDLLASGDEDGSIIISKFNDGSLNDLHMFSAPGPIRSLMFSARGDYLLAATFDKQLSVWNSNQLNSGNAEKNSVKKYSDYIKAIACLNLAGDDYVLVSTGDKLSIEKITANGLLAIDSLSIPNVNVITVSKDQSTLLLASNENLYEYKIGESAVFTDPKITNVESQIMSIAISDKNEFIAVGLLSGHIRIKDMSQENQSSRSFKDHHSRVSSLNFHEFEDIIQLTSTGFDQSIKMIDVHYLLYGKGEPAEDKITIDDGHDKWIHGGLYSSDGKYYITIGEDKKIKTWHSTTADLVDSVQKILNERKK
jgi:WD40 repeat protein/energy-coupling factor transporter ATP-binding protein EcfA2